MSDDERLHLNEEDRYELAAAAAASERSNRPRALLVVALVFVVASGAFLLVSLASRSSAMTGLANERSRVGDMQRYASQIDALRERADRTGPGAGATRIPDILSRFKQIGVASGIDPGLPDETQDARPGVRRLEYVFDDIRHPELDPVLEFIERAQEQIPGLETRRIRVRPLANVWHVEVTFSRWERTESA